MMTRTVVDDVLPDILAPGLDVVFCGTAVGPRSAAKGAYYVDGSNSFWNTLRELGLTPTNLKDHQWKLLPLGLGLTDLVKKTSGVDSSLHIGDCDPKGLRDRLRQTAPNLRVLAFNGKTAAAYYLNGNGRTKYIEYGPRPDPSNAAECLFVLTSTSGMARGQRKLHPHVWEDLVRYLGRRPDFESRA
jgi:TDG/mug DNA glycosylase family protein